MLDVPFRPGRRFLTTATARRLRGPCCGRFRPRRARACPLGRWRGAQSGPRLRSASPADAVSPHEHQHAVVANGPERLRLEAHGTTPRLGIEEFPNFFDTPRLAVRIGSPKVQPGAEVVPCHQRSLDSRFGRETEPPAALKALEGGLRLRRRGARVSANRPGRPRPRERTPRRRAPRCPSPLPPPPRASRRAPGAR